jgi:hypothetical protein
MNDRERAAREQQRIGRTALLDQGIKKQAGVERQKAGGEDNPDPFSMNAFCLLPC